MEKQASHAIGEIEKYILTFMKWTFLSTLTGLICGLIGTAFHILVEKATEFRAAHSWVLFFLPVAGMIIVLLYRIARQQNDKGTNLIIASVRSGEEIPAVMAPLIFISTVITHLFGGSAGREGAALQIGGSVAAAIGRKFNMEPDDIRIITMCGMSAMFSALFGTPLTAAVFAMEVISVGIIYYTAFLPCIIAAFVGVMVSENLGVEPVAYQIAKYPGVNLGSVIRVIILAAVCALISIVFCIVMNKVAQMYRKYLKNTYLRAFAGGLIILALTFALGTFDYNGAGMNIVDAAINGNARYEAFVIKIIFTALTLGAGFRGGEIVPAFYVGATLGCVVGPVIGLDPGFAAAVGIVSVFCGVVNCPIASVFLAIELFSSTDYILFAVACAVSYMLSGYYGLYSSQKIIYSKLSPSFININTKH